MLDATHDFLNTIRSAGIEPPDHITPGKFHRFPGAGKSKSNQAAWCLLFEDGMAGSYGDWSTGLSENWHFKQNKPFSASEHSKYQKRIKAAQKNETAKKVNGHANAAICASDIWKKSTIAKPCHPYLRRKGIQTHGAKALDDSLVLPIISFEGTLTSLQYIAPNGAKKLLWRGKKQGCFIPIDYYSAPTDILNAADKTRNQQLPFRVIITEGWATACSLAETESTSVVVAAIDAGNLKSVAMSTRKHWPDAEIIIASDDDRQTAGNPGLTKAKAAAQAANALIWQPIWPDNAPEILTDFNDLHTWIKGELS